MSTPAPIFTPFLNTLSWVDATTGVANAPLAPGEVLQDTVIGVRADGDAAHSLGNYQYQISVNAPASSLTRAAFDAAVAAAYGSALAPGNYWLNGEQTDVLGGATATSAWGATEVPFSIPTPIVVPSSPTGFSIA
jgi:hypothetical protein